MAGPNFRSSLPKMDLSCQLMAIFVDGSRSRNQLELSDVRILPGNLVRAPSLEKLTPIAADPLWLISLRSCSLDAWSSLAGPEILQFLQVLIQPFIVAAEHMSSSPVQRMPHLPVQRAF